MLPRPLVTVLAICVLTQLVACRKTLDVSASVLKTTIVTTGNLAGQTVKAAGFVAKAGVDGTAQILAPGVVAVVNESGETVRSMPWEKGLTLYAATKEAQLDAAVKTVLLLRGREVFKRSISEVSKGTGDIKLRRGDRIKFLR
jgi:hypothetical protein